MIDATRVVDEHGAVLWEGDGLGVSGARRGRSSRWTGSSTTRRAARLRAATGADAVDMESGVLAATGRLRGCIRAISDTPRRRSGRWPRR